MGSCSAPATNPVNVTNFIVLQLPWRQLTYGRLQWTSFCRSPQCVGTWYGATLTAPHIAGLIQACWWPLWSPFIQGGTAHKCTCGVYVSQHILQPSSLLMEFWHASLTKRMNLQVWWLENKIMFFRLVLVFLKHALKKKLNLLMSCCNKTMIKLCCMKGKNCATFISLGCAFIGTAALAWMKGVG